jgi:hypothetical protein
VVESGGRGWVTLQRFVIYLAPNFNGRNKDKLLLTGAED